MFAKRYNAGVLAGNSGAHVKNFRLGEGNKFGRTRQEFCATVGSATLVCSFRF